MQIRMALSLRISFEKNGKPADRAPLRERIDRAHQCGAEIFAFFRGQLPEAAVLHQDHRRSRPDAVPADGFRIAGPSGIDGRDREQYCGMCGTVWPFERMRCGVCGTENAARLHYFHVEGDSSHRLQNCDECGQYQRMVFEEDLSIPLSMEVEDVVMAKLDAIALDPRFRTE